MKKITWKYPFKISSRYRLQRI